MSHDWLISLLLIHITFIYGQTIKPHRLCIDQEAKVSHGSFGVVYHDPKSHQQTACTLTISGFKFNSYISIPGIDLATNACKEYQTYPAVDINGVKYCITGDDSSNSVILPLSVDLLVISMQHVTTSFAFQYYSNVVVCANTKRLNTVYFTYSSVTQLSGMLATSYNLSNPTVLESRCGFSISGPGWPAHMKFDLLYTQPESLPQSLRIGYKNFRPGSMKGESLLINASRFDKESSLIVNMHNAGKPVSFLLRYTVLHCPDMSGLDATNDLLLPFNNYTCAKTWQSEQEGNTARCEVKPEEMIAKWTVSCVPDQNVAQSLLIVMIVMSVAATLAVIVLFIVERKSVFRRRKCCCFVRRSGKHGRQANYVKSVQKSGKRRVHVRRKTKLKPDQPSQNKEYPSYIDYGSGNQWMVVMSANQGEESTIVHTYPYPY